MATTNHPLTPLGVEMTKALKRSGMSQNEVARRVGIATGSWNTIAYGGRELGGNFVPVKRTDPKTIAKIAFVLGLNIADTLALRGYTLDDVLPMQFDLTSVPTVQLVKELRRRDPGIVNKKWRSAKNTDTENTDTENAAEFSHALAEVAAGRPQPPASAEWRHADAR
jgi:transcriptional regulator with XRE-family HTH domain